MMSAMAHAESLSFRNRFACAAQGTNPATNDDHSALCLFNSPSY